jgi:hypothetical protein
MLRSGLFSWESPDADYFAWFDFLSPSPEKGLVAVLWIGIGDQPDADELSDLLGCGTAPGRLSRA